MLMTVWGCSEEISDLSLDPGYDFLPLQVGNFWTYEVEEITYEVFEPDTSTYLLKEVISDSIVAPGGAVKYLISRYKGDSVSSLVLDSVWAVRVTERAAIFTEHNKDYVKLSFPVAADVSWDGNAYNTLESTDFYYQNVNDYMWNGETYPAADAIRVIISDVEQNLVNQDERSEVYLRTIGLVEKDYIQLSFCTVNCEDKGSDIGEIEKGKILKQKLIAYGKE